MEVGENGSNGLSVLYHVTEENSQEFEYVTIQNRRMEEKTALMMAQAHRRPNPAMRITVQVMKLFAMYIILTIVIKYEITYYFLNIALYMLLIL